MKKGLDCLRTTDIEKLSVVCVLINVVEGLLCSAKSVLHFLFVIMCADFFGRTCELSTGDPEKNIIASSGN